MIVEVYQNLRSNATLFVLSTHLLTNTNRFYIDKTDFIREWWENGSTVTLITRPRRFGKT